MLLPFIVQIVIDGEFETTSLAFKKAVNSFCFAIFDGTPVEADKDSFNQQVALPLWTPVLSQLPHSYFWHSVRIGYPLNAGDVPQQFPVGNRGPRIESRLPSPNCVRVNLNSTVRGRRYRGFKLIGPVATSDAVGDLLTPTAVGSWSQATAGFGSTFSDVSGVARNFTLFPVIWSREGSVAGEPMGTGEGALITSVTLLQTLGRVKHRRERTSTA